MLTMHVNQQWVGFLIGPRGATLNRVRDLSGASIQIDQETRAQGYSIAKFYGTPEAAAEAQRLVNAKLAEVDPALKPTGPPAGGMMATTLPAAFRVGRPSVPPGGFASEPPPRLPAPPLPLHRPPSQVPVATGIPLPTTVQQASLPHVQPVLAPSGHSAPMQAPPVRLPTTLPTTQSNSTVLGVDGLASPGATPQLPAGAPGYHAGSVPKTCGLGNAMASVAPQKLVASGIVPQVWAPGMLPPADDPDPIWGAAP